MRLSPLAEAWEALALSPAEVASRLSMSPRAYLA
jgi:hypothetical protein